MTRYGKWILIALVFIGLSMYAAKNFTKESLPPRENGGLKTDPNEAFLSIGKLVIPVEISQSTEEVTKGLSGRISLPEERGMLFIFPRPDIYRFWMPDMNFPIDIIWIENSKIVDISENVSNDFNPQTPIFYTPSNPVRYVLEVNAGFSRKNNLKIGEQVTFHNVP